MLAEAVYEADDGHSFRYTGPPSHSPFDNQHLSPGQEIPQTDEGPSIIEMAQTTEQTWPKRPSEDDLAQIRYHMQRRGDFAQTEAIPFY